MSKARVVNQYLLSAKRRGLMRLHNNADQAYTDLCAVLKKKFPNHTEVTAGSTFKVEYTIHNETKTCYLIYEKSKSVARAYVSVFTFEQGFVGLELLEEVCETIFKSDNVISNFYDVILLRDGVSEKYSNKIFPQFNEFERKLKALMFAVYTQEYGSAYFDVVHSHVQNSVKGSTSSNKELKRVQELFFGLSLGDIQSVLFTPYWSPADETYYHALLNDERDYSKCSDEEIRQLFLTLKPKCDWDKFFAKLFREKDMYNIINKLREYRNLVAHCKAFSTEQYNDSKILLKKAIKQLDMALNSITPKNDSLIDTIAGNIVPCGNASMIGQLFQGKPSYNSADLEEIVRRVADTIAMSSAHVSIDTDTIEPLRYSPPKRIGKATKRYVKPHYHRKALKK